MASASSHHKDPAHVISGLKATISNPNTSDEAKNLAQERLKELTGVSGQEDQQHVNRILGKIVVSLASGYKATLHNEGTSKEAKQHAREILEAAGIDPSDLRTDAEHETRVIAGYKAALHNPRVSPGAKKHAEEFLKAHKAL
ncbi:uncharacterized protein EV420DRAFT_1620049 [Desarmillaria tabescens]|uniref:Conidiation-specific protein 6 n=1 Tax=Armillaria tabescens TaxID=1929756 RepID=A0AA39N6R7_ARMTA|nr:uncharacterized protein EV420DRAFT_1620049 [Desarmillaria tabescens]KAK0460276.1 hypothetical protein EV420DRAFT_1620049 [Desarmillaria tabescens]